MIDSKGEEAKKRGVAIAYDSRHFSPEFAFESAQVLAAHGIKSYVFESLRPTPELVICCSSSPHICWYHGNS